VVQDLGMFQETRRHILDILKKHPEMTVDELVEVLHQSNEKKVTAATIRHHLDILQENGLVEAPQVRRRESPGRPQYVYRLTDKGLDFFPSNYAGLASSLLEQMRNHLPRPEINVILEGVADQMSAQAGIPKDLPIEERLDYVVGYLTAMGYEANWEADISGKGYILSTSNCPFEKVAQSHDDVCSIDMHLIANLLGVVPRRLGRIAEGNQSCNYFIHNLDIVVAH
jgi:DeoR family suf operon transcriptional repressor